MPRVSDAEKKKSHDRILDAAGQLFRKEGIERTSLAEVMKAAGMTHGGFYRHFATKDDLTAASLHRAVDQAVAGLEAGAKKGCQRAAQAEYTDTYLSQEHVQTPAIGCPLAALGSELARMQGPARAEAGAAVGRVAELLADEGEAGAGYARLALLLGAVSLARMVDSPEQSARIVSAARDAMVQLG